MKPLNPVPNQQPVKEAFSELHKLFDTDIPKVSESVFRQKILPILVNDSKAINFEPWLEVSDSILRPIDVMVGSRVVFRCPAIGRPVSFRSSDSPRDSMFEQIAKAQQKEDIVPGMGQNYIQNCLKARVGEGTLSAAELDQWRAVFSYYNYTAGAELLKSEPGREEATPESKGFLADDYDLA